MSTIELKNKAHSLIETINDSETLQAIIILLRNNEEVKDKDWYDDLSESDKKSIQTGLNQANKKEFVSEQSVRNEVNELFEKYGK